MKKIYIVLAFIAQSIVASAQNPGLVISELLANPPGTDNAFEWVELVATRAIDFSVTPYSVVVCNNGTATVNGWVNGGTLSYGFNITTGTVVAGDIVYVGGSTMLPTGTKLRTINVVSTAGDGFGTAAAGVFGNGGANADGIAVFNMAIGSVTNSTVPVDAIFYGTGIGTALVNAGADGYQLPINDRYTGGKLQTTSFFGSDPASDFTLKATGFFNTTTNLWFGQRAWTTQATLNDNATAIQLVTVDPPGSAAISVNTQTVSETAGSVNVNVTFANANNNPAKVVFGLSSYSNAVRNVDFSYANDTLVIPANSNGTFPFTIQLTNDLLAERTERIIVKLIGTVNANIIGNSFQIIHLTDNDYQAPVASNELSMSLLSSFSNGAEGTNSAEIVAYDSTNFRLYIANSVGAKIDIVDFSNPVTPVLLNSISVAPYGNINSITVYNGIVAAAIENTIPESNGSVVFFNANGVFLNQVTVGAMPDMIAFNNNHTKIVVACEGQPKTDYTIDPEGSIAIVDLTPGIVALTNSNVAIAGFTAYNGQEAALRAQGIRIFGPGSTAAQDFEPEYITFGDDNQTAYVSLQENNAMAVVNLNTATVTSIRPLGLMDYSTNNGMDASDQTAGVYISSVPVKGAFMPDAIAHATIAGQEYIFSANEGDAREYAALTDVARLSATSLDATAFPDQNILKSNQFLGRLNALQATGDTDNDGDKDEIHVLGTRSFSIWNAATGALVYDSKDLLEQITAAHPTLNGLFNASNTSGTAVSKNRSDDKGPEPEGVATAFINGNHYLFVSLERVGGVLTFNIDNPSEPVYAGYYNNRSVATNGPDRGAEGIIYISKEASPTNKALVLLANEISSTLSVYQVNTCVELAGATITAGQTAVCSGSSTQLSIPGNAQSSVQWYYNGAALPGETANTLTANQAGSYRVYVSNTALSCADTTVATTITILPLPVVDAGADQSVCAGTSVTLSGLGAQAYTWNGGVTNNLAFTPGSTQTYTVTGTAANGCTKTDDVVVTVNSLPSTNAGVDQSVCAGTTITLSGSGAQSYAWNGGVTDNLAFTPVSTQTYTVTGTGANGCTKTDQVIVTVKPLPTVSAGADQQACTGDQVTLIGLGAISFTWNNGVTNNSAFTPASTQTYTVTGTAVNGCTNTDQVVVTVNAIPVISAGINQSVCIGSPVTLAGTGGQTYSWNNGVANGVSFVPQTTSTYTVAGTDANGCENTANVLVTVNNLPIVIAGTDQLVCAGESIVLAATGAQNYAWSNGVTDGVGFVPTNTGTYNVTGTDANGCSNSDQLLVTVNTLPSVNAGSDITVCSEENVTLSGTGAQNYQWSNGISNGTPFSATATTTYTLTGTDANGCEDTDQITVTVNELPIVALGADTTTCSNYGPILLDAGAGFTAYSWNTNAQTQTVNAIISGTYIVTVTNADGCSNSDAITVTFDPCLGVAEQTIEMMLFPNPTNSIVTVKSTSNEPMRAEVMTVTGQLLFSTTESTIDLSGYASGTYMIRMQQGTHQELFRVEKTN